MKKVQQKNVKNKKMNKKKKGSIFQPLSFKERVFVFISLVFCLVLPFLLLLMESQKLDITQQTELVKTQLSQERTKSTNLSLQINKNTTQR